MTTTGDLFVNLRANTDGLRKGLDRSKREIQQFSQRTERILAGGLSAPGALVQGLTMLPTLGRGLTSSLRLPSLRRQDQTALKQYRQGLKSGTLTDAIRQRRLDTSAAFRGAQASSTRAMSLIRPLLTGPAVIGAAAAVAGIIIAENATRWSKRIQDATERLSPVVAREKALAEARDIRRDLELARDPANQAAALFHLRSQEYRRNSGSPALGQAMTYARGAGNYAFGGVSDYLGGRLPIGPGFPLGLGYPRWIFGLFRSLFAEGGVT